MQDRRWIRCGRILSMPPFHQGLVHARAPLLADPLGEYHPAGWSGQSSTSSSATSNVSVRRVSTANSNATFTSTPPCFEVWGSGPAPGGTDTDPPAVSREAGGPFGTTTGLRAADAPRVQARLSTDSPAEFGRRHARCRKRPSQASQACAPSVQQIGAGRARRGLHEVALFGAAAFLPTPEPFPSPSARCRP